MVKAQDRETKPNALLLLSGGLDSAAQLGLSRDSGFQIKKAITFDYGQRAVNCEIRAAQRLCEFAGIEHRVIEVSWLGQLGKNALTDTSVKVPEVDQSVLDRLDVCQESAKSVWVPNRNGVFLNIAASIAEAEELDVVLVGFNREEAMTFPDNSRDYMSALNRAFEFSTRSRVRVESMSVDMNKKEMVAKLRELKDPSFPFELIWSCYFGDEKPCQKCESCQRLARALA